MLLFLIGPNSDSSDVCSDDNSGVNIALVILLVIAVIGLVICVVIIVFLVVKMKQLRCVAVAS